MTGEDVKLEAQIVWPVAAHLGEGPLWDEAEQALWFVDIKQGRLHRYRPEDGERATFEIGGQPSFVVIADNGSLILGDGHALRPFVDGTLGEPLAHIDMPEHNRTNDATVDSAGRLWFGTMANGETQASGAVHLFDGREVRAVGGECVITNGPAVSPDGTLLYHVDTLGGRIWRFDISQSERLDHGSLFVEIDPADGAPDGVTMDSEDCLWVALWGGGQVRRYAPDGELLTCIALPCANVTKIAFGGGDLRTAFVTTARVGLSEEELARQPLAGGLFAFEAPAPGLPAQAVRLAR